MPEVDRAASNQRLIRTFVFTIDQIFLSVSLYQHDSFFCFSRSVIISYLVSPSGILTGLTPRGTLDLLFLVQGFFCENAQCMECAKVFLKYTLCEVNISIV